MLKSKAFWRGVPVGIRVIAAVVGAVGSLSGAGLLGHKAGRNAAESEFSSLVADLRKQVDLLQAFMKDLASIRGPASPLEGKLWRLPGSQIEEELALASNVTDKPVADLVFRILGVGVAHAETTSDADKLKEVRDSMRTRYPTLRRYKADATVGEDRRGYVSEIPKQLLSPEASEKMSDEKYAKALRKTIEEENADRRQLYEIRAGTIRTTVEKAASIYAEGWRASANPGEWIEVLVDEKKNRWEWQKRK
ncbi:MAG: DUF1318 domain-containing protein [bacterium]|nr:DUF1318 domain-containing protein [bacterium]